MVTEVRHTAGIGLRVEHLEEILSKELEIGWLELLSDNHIHESYLQRKKVDAVAERYPVTLHSVGLSIGSIDELDHDYLRKLKSLIDRFQPLWVSEHLCWTSVHGHHFHDLMPLPFTEETIDHVVPRIKAVQDILDQQILIENISSYIQYTMSEMNEWEFLTEIVERADCFILLDVNNVYVSGSNHGFSPLSYIHGLPTRRVREIHLGGYSEHDGLLIDSHSSAVSPEVWKLYRTTLSVFGPQPTLIEWDNDIPRLDDLLGEARRAESLLAELS